MLVELFEAESFNLDIFKRLEVGVEHPVGEHWIKDMHMTIIYRDISKAMKLLITEYEYVWKRESWEWS